MSEFIKFSAVFSLVAFCLFVCFVFENIYICHLFLEIWYNGRPLVQPPEDGILETSFLLTQLTAWVSINVSGVIFLFLKKKRGQNVSEVPRNSKSTTVRHHQAPPLLYLIPSLNV